MNKFTTSQLQQALIELYRRDGVDAQAAYRMTFDELHARMGDELFDVWCESQGF